MLLVEHLELIVLRLTNLQSHTMFCYIFTVFACITMFYFTISGVNYLVSIALRAIHLGGHLGDTTYVCLSPRYTLCWGVLVTSNMLLTLTINCSTAIIHTVESVSESRLAQNLGSSESSLCISERLS